MLYTVTTVEQKYLEELGIESVATDHQIATLDEAAGIASMALVNVPRPGNIEAIKKLNRQIRDLTYYREASREGATIGPFPDDSVIEIKPLKTAHKQTPEEFQARMDEIHGPDQKEK